jgi:hypothetical protein
MQIGFFGLLFIVLMALKLTGVVAISWGMLFLILFTPAIAIFLFVFIAAMVKLR